MTKRIFVFTFGVIVYLVFIFTVLYGIGFTGNVFVPKDIDSGSSYPTTTALIVDFALIILFALQHTVMARPTFKRKWLRYIPEPAERSVYVLLASLALLLLFWQWRPLTQPIWSITNGFGQSAVRAVFWLGWLAVVLSTLLINHLDLFGLRQVYFYLRGTEYQPVPFKRPLPYRYVRHPLMLSFLIAFWATPQMTLGHLVFASGMTLFIFIGTMFEERDLVQNFGESYERYRRQVSMIIPLPRRDVER